MQLIGAYVIFLVAIAALVVGLAVCGVVGAALYECAAWFRSTHPHPARPLAGIQGNVNDIKA
jgi:hypothetical protein